MAVKDAGNGGGSATARWVPLMEGEPGHQSVKYVTFLSVVMFMTWPGSRDALASQPPDYYEHALMGYASLFAAAYLGFTAPARREAGAEIQAVRRMTARLLGSSLDALYLALLTLPFLAAVRILTLLEEREVILTLLLIVVFFTTYRFISLQLSRAMKRRPLLLYALQLTLFTLVLFLSLIFYPPLSPFHAFHSVTAASTLILGDGGFYHPLGPYLDTILAHGLLLGALISFEMLLGMKVSARDET